MPRQRAATPASDVGRVVTGPHRPTGGQARGGRHLVASARRATTGLRCDHAAQEHSAPDRSPSDRVLVDHPEGERQPGVRAQPSAAITPTGKSHGHARWSRIRRSRSECPPRLAMSTRNASPQIFRGCASTPRWSHSRIPERQGYCHRRCRGYRPWDDTGHRDALVRIATGILP